MIISDQSCRTVKDILLKSSKLSAEEKLQNIRKSVFDNIVVHSMFFNLVSSFFVTAGVWLFTVQSYCITLLHSAQPYVINGSRMSPVGSG